MSTLDTSSSGSLDTGALVALGLLGAGLAVGAGTLLRSPENRATCARIMRELGLPQLGRDVAAAVLVKLGVTLSSRDALGGTP